MGCGNEYIEYYVGEKREFEGYALPKNTGETVVITSAKYKVTRAYSDEVIFSGNCEIDGNKFRTMLSFNEPGNYVFTVTLSIGDEEPIEKAYICVKG